MLAMNSPRDADHDATDASISFSSSPLTRAASFSRRSSMSSVASSVTTTTGGGGWSATASTTASTSVDPQILKKLSASVSHFHGPRKNLSYVVSVETLVPGRRAFQEERESCQFVTRSFDDFRRFRKSLLARVGSKKHDPSALFSSSGKCHCEGRGKGCSFDATRSFLERLRFTRMPFLSFGGANEEDLTKRQLEMNSFLRIVFAILHRMQPSAWQTDCLFLRDVLAFLEVEEAFLEQIEEILKHKSRQLGLQGWKAHSRDTFGSGIRL
ncbi:hypothetical protein Gpo141_00007537 [Globisporangium polare]